MASTVVQVWPAPHQPDDDVAVLGSWEDAGLHHVGTRVREHVFAIVLAVKAMQGSALVTPDLALWFVDQIENTGCERIEFVYRNETSGWTPCWGYPMRDTLGTALLTGLQLEGVLRLMTRTNVRTKRLEDVYVVDKSALDAWMAAKILCLSGE